MASNHQWFRSEKKNDFVFMNNHVSIKDVHTHWCDRRCADFNYWNKMHFEKNDNQPYLNKYQPGTTYQFGCFGCSVTRGTGTYRGEEWPALIEKDGGSVINLAENGLGPDGIYLNLSNALKEFNITKILIVFPNLARRLQILQKGKLYMRVPTTIGDCNNDEALRYSVFCTPEQRQILLNKLAKDMASGYLERRSEKIIKNTIKLIQDHGKTGWFSSYDDATYSYLESLGIGASLLPRFPKSDNLGLDKQHHSAKQHLEWYQQIKARIGL